MGFRVQLIAVSGMSPAKVQQDFGVEPTGEYEEVAESPVVGAELPDGRYLLYVNDADRIIPDNGVYARLSRGAKLVACYANETVMNSYACGWVDGTERWSVFHDAQQSITHLEVSGTPPAELGPIRDRLLGQQAEVTDPDYVFDVPVELFVALGGMRYDEDLPDAEPEPWEILEPVA